MDRLQTELLRLYLPQGATEFTAEGLVASDGRVRGLVLELVQPAGWQEVARVWQGVQADLDLPAPAIAISGADAYQLWFSLAQAVPQEQGRAFLQSLCARYLQGVPAERIRIGGAGAMPPAQAGPEHWSAFVAPDLAPLFSGEPWLDHPPGRDAQADLLSRIARVTPQAFERAASQLLAAPAPAPAAAEKPQARPAAADPRSFLLSVMQDPSVDLRLRVEAAKALLPAFNPPRSS